MEFVNLSCIMQTVAPEMLPVKVSGYKRKVLAFHTASLL